MTIKQKFDRIDQSKLEPNQVNALKIVVDFTENFKTKDKEKIRVTNEKLDNIIGKLQEKNPNALKPIRSPRKTTNAKISSTKTPKRNVFSVAKEIKKAGETFEEAKARASQQLKKEKEEANKTIKTEMQKLQEYIKAHKELQGISGTDLGRDAGRVAKMGGRRISKNGNIYYENRENRKDRLAPNYPKNAPLLEYGGDFQSGVYADGGAVSEDLFENYEKQPKELSEIVDFYMNKFEEGDYDYQDSQNFLKEVEAIGYTFDYGLDNEPYGLRPIGTELNDYANGGDVQGKDTWQNIFEEFGFKKGRSKYGLDIYSKRGYSATVDNKQRNVELMFDNDVIYNGFSIQGLLDVLQNEFGKRNFSNGGEFMTDTNFGNFQNQVYAYGGGVEIDNLNKNTDLRDKMIDYIVSNKAYGKRMSDRQYDALEKRISDKSFVQLKKEYDALKENNSFANGGGVEIEIKGKKHNLSMKNSITKGDRVVLRYPINNGKRSDNPLDGEVGTIIQVNKDGSYNLYEDYQKHVVKLDNGETIEELGRYMSVLMPEYADGGELVDYSDNQLMVMNQNVQIEHHHEELEDVLQNKTEVPAWVVAKMATATQNISDITHYLDGERELLEEDNEEDDEEEVIVDSITIPSSISKTEQTKKFTEDALGNMKGFLKGKDGIELEDDYTFKYKGKNYEIEPVVNYNEKGVSNALFIVYNDNDEQVGEINYTSGSGKQNFTAKSDLFNWNNVKFEDGGYFDGTIPNVSSYMSNYAKGGEIDKAEIFSLKRNIMGTTDIEMKIAGMRKPQSFIVYPINKDDSADIITIQSETRIGKIDLSNGRGLMSQSHANGAYYIHLQMDKKTPFTISESDLEKLKMQIFKTAGDNVGSRGIVTDNSGASKVFAVGGGIGFIPMDLEKDLALLAKWGGTNIKGVIGILNAMIDSGVTNEDLIPKPTKNTLFQIEKATEKKIQEIWNRIKPNYKGDFKGNMYYSTLKEMISRNSIYKDLLTKFKPFRKYQKDSFADGGAIKNQYEGKSADEVWKDWNYDQKYHFLSDHREKIGFEEDLYNESKRTTKPKKSSMGTDIGFMYIDIDKIINTKYTELPRYVKFALLDHVRTGQYARGGGFRERNGRKYDIGRNWTKDHNYVNKSEKHEMNYNRKKSMAKGGSTEKYKVGQKFYDTRYDRVCEIVPSSYDGLVTWKRYNKSGTEFENDTQHSLVENQFDYLVDMGAYQISKQSMAKGGLLTPRERYVLEIKGLTGLRVTAIESYIEENGLSNDDILNIVIGLGRRQLKGSDVATAVVGNKGNSASKKLIAFAKGNEALKMELGGAMATDLAGHTGGSMGTNTPSLLSGYSGTNYTGLVGETGAMSSGEMFMAGGSVDKNFDLTGYKWLATLYNLKEAKEYCNQARKRFPNEKTVVIKIDEEEYYVYGTDSFNKGKTGNRVYELGGAIKDYVEVSNPNTELFQKGYGIYGGDAWETFADIKKAFPDGLPKDAFVVKLVSGKYPSFVIAEKRTDEYNNGGSLPDGVQQNYINYYLGSTGVLAGGGVIDLALNKKVYDLAKKKKFLMNDYLNDNFSVSEYNIILAQALVESLTDANFHSEAKEVVAKLEKQVWSDDLYNSKYFNADQEISEFGRDVARICDYDGDDILNAYYNLAKTQGSSVGNLIEKLFLSKSGKYEEGGEVEADNTIAVSFSIFEKIINESKSEEDAFNKAREVKGIPLEASKSFMEKYDPNRELTPRQSFSKFYKEVKANASKPSTDWWNTVVNPNEDFYNFDDKMPIDWEVDDFKEWVVSKSDLDGNLDKEVLDVVKMPKSKLTVDYLNKNGSGKNNNEFYKKYGNWQSALYDIFTQMKKDYLASKSSSKSKKYIDHDDIVLVNIKKGSKQLTYKAVDVLNGANILEKVGQLEKIANYIPIRNVISVDLKDGTQVKPSNGFWIKKDAKPYIVGKLGTFDEGGEVEEAIINKDGIKVKSVAQPKNKPTEAEWLAKYNESKEARTYKSGGNLSKYSQFIQDEFPASKRLANKFSKKYDSPFLVLVEKGNGDTIYVKQAESFYAFPKSYIDAHDVLYVTPDAMAFGGFFGKKQDEAPKEKVKDFTGKEVVTSDGVYVIVLMQYKDTALVKEIGNQFKDAYKIDLKKIQTPENMKMAMGGATFDEKSSAIAKKFVGKSVEPKYQKEYGKVYSKEEANEVGDKIAGSIVAKSKMTKGGITNRGGIMLLAKQIRKDNESWKDALKRAGEQLRK